jgi:biofilm PGA synthesis lipoprotein PgaB
MKNIIKKILILLLIFCPQVVFAFGDFTVICYHDVKAIDQGDLDTDQYAISPENLLAEFEWLKANGFHVISVDELLAAHRGEKPLPEKSVLLTFDDGYLSFYTEIYPLLKLYKYPAVFSLVGSWLDVPNGQFAQYGDQKIARSHFLQWQQIKEMHDSGLVEIASHSYDLHRGLLANPQGNTQPAAVTREYANGQYENDAVYQARIKADLAQNASLIKKHLGKAPRLMVWPYGAYSLETMAIAESMGMSLNFTLEGGTPNDIKNSRVMHRQLITANPKTGDFAYMLNHLRRPPPRRMIHIDLDYIYDADPVQQEHNLGVLVERIKTFNINTVYLQAFADPDGDGDVDALYFPNRHLPVRADLFNRVAWQLRTRAGVQVYAWMPVLAFDFGAETYSRLGVKEYKDGQLQNATASYKRLSPFNPEARTIINEIYADLGKHCSFYGLLFHDDAYFTDFEDFGPEAQSWYQQQGVPQSPAGIRGNPDLLQQLATIKTDYLIDFTMELKETVRIYQPDIKTARTMYALPVLNPKSEVWFAQNLEKFVAHYDTTAIMAMPYMENAHDPEEWLLELIGMVKRRVAKPQFSKVLFELQAMDWRTREPLESDVLAAHMRLLLKNQVNHMGYYPDDFLNNRPELQAIRPVFSLQIFPYKRH